MGFKVRAAVREVLREDANENGGGWKRRNAAVAEGRKEGERWVSGGGVYSRTDTPL